MRYVSHITLAVLSTFVAANLLAGCPSGGCRYQRGPSSQNYSAPVPNQNYYSNDSYNQNYFDHPQDSYGHPQQSPEIVNPDFHPRQGRGYPMSHRDHRYSRGFQETVYYDQYNQGATRPNDSSFNDYSNTPDYMNQQQPQSFNSADENSARFAAPVSKSNYRLKPRGFNPELIRDESGYNGVNNPYANSSYGSQPSYSSGEAYSPHYQGTNGYPMNRPSYSSERPDQTNARYFDESTFNSTLNSPANSASMSQPQGEPNGSLPSSNPVNR